MRPPAALQQGAGSREWRKPKVEVKG